MPWPWMTLASQLCWNCSCNSALVVSSPARRPLWSCIARSKVSTWQKGKPKRSFFSPWSSLTFDNHTVTTLYHISKILTRNGYTPYGSARCTTNHCYLCPLRTKTRPWKAPVIQGFYPPWNQQFAPPNRPGPQKETILFQASISRGKLAVSFREGRPFKTLILLGKLQNSAHPNRHIGPPALAAIDARQIRPSKLRRVIRPNEAMNWSMDVNGWFVKVGSFTIWDMVTAN